MERGGFSARFPRACGEHFEAGRFGGAINVVEMWIRLTLGFKEEDGFRKSRGVSVVFVSR